MARSEDKATLTRTIADGVQMVVTITAGLKVKAEVPGLARRGEYAKSLSAIERSVKQIVETATRDLGPSDGFPYIVAASEIAERQGYELSFDNSSEKGRVY